MGFLTGAGRSAGGADSDHPARGPSRDLTRRLSHCAAFVDIDDGELDRLARTATAIDASEGHPIESAGRPLMVERGALLVCEPGGRAVDLVGPGGLRATNGVQELIPLTAVSGVALPAEAIHLAWAALRNRPTSPRSRSTGSAQLWSASVSTVMREADYPSCPSMSGPSIAAGAPVVEALLEMLSAGATELQVLQDDRPVGTITMSDLPGPGEIAARHLITDIGAAEAVGPLSSALDTLPAAVRWLLSAGATATDCGRMLARVADRVMRRLLPLAIQELGDPPASFGWLVFGSQARREQSLDSDQDTGLVYPAGLDARSQAWFAQLGNWMTDALERCGYARCPGKVMASNADWRHDVDGWRQAIARWTEPKTMEHLLGADIGFDTRCVGGNLDVEHALVRRIAEGTASELVQARLAQDVLRRRPPPSLFGHVATPPVGPRRGTFDAKRRAIQPIVDLARLLTFARGGTELGTVHRLAAAAVSGQLSPPLAASLREGYELLLRLRLETQLTSPQAGSRIPLAALSPGVEAELARVFRDIITAQGVLRARYQITVT